MKKIIIIWVFWTLFWAAITQAIYYYQMQDARQFIAGAQSVTGKVIAIDSQLRRVADTASSPSTSERNISYTNKTYYRIVANYSFNNIEYTHRFGFSSVHPDVAKGDPVKLYISPQAADAPRIENYENKYDILKYGWIIMAVFPIILMGPAFIFLMIIKKFLPWEKVSKHLTTVSVDQTTPRTPKDL
jgi:hypothetical protein